MLYGNFCISPKRVHCFGDMAKTPIFCPVPAGFHIGDQGHASKLRRLHLMSEAKRHESTSQANVATFSAINVPRMRFIHTSIIISLLMNELQKALYDETSIIFHRHAPLEKQASSTMCAEEPNWCADKTNRRGIHTGA